MNGKLRLLIVDDEPRARSLIRKMVRADSEVEIVAECANGYEAVAAVKERTADVMFLDVQMPEMDGFAVLRNLDGWELPAIVFVTAYDQYALRAFEVHALDYLLKPFDKERFLRTLQRAKAQLRAATGFAQSQRIAELLERTKTAGSYLERIALKENGRVVLLKVSEIDWIEAEENYVRLHAGERSHMMRQSLTELESKLNPQQFSRVHRSAVINLAGLKEIRPQFHGEYRLLLQNGAQLTLTRTYRDRFFAKFGRSRS